MVATNKKVVGGVLWILCCLSFPLSAELDYEPLASDVLNSLEKKNKKALEPIPAVIIPQKENTKKKKIPRKKHLPLDPSNIPEMVAIKGNVTQVDFFIGKTEITVKHYMDCVKAGVCRNPKWKEKNNAYHIETGTKPLFKKLGTALTGNNYPIVGVNWNDALDYAQWLSQQTKKHYRLPTNAEWQYASGAETTTYVWGNKIGNNKANCRPKSCGDAYRYAAPVASFPAYNKLHDMYGNVSEWVCISDDISQCKIKSYSGSRSKARGGSWDSSAKLLQSTYQEISYPNLYRLNDVGFRLVRIP